ncbi:MAG: hypothetical protein AAF724_21840 [Pseudomonadota bacterium]
MFPFLYTTNNIEYPLSGDVTQDISSAFISTMKGVPAVEKEVVTRVASYGDQLGTLTDAVLAIAHAKGVRGKEIRKLSRIADAVEDVKEDFKAELRTRAEVALEQLKKADPETYRKVIAKAYKY